MAPLAMIASVLILMFLGIAAGPALAEVRTVGGRRLAGWLLLVGLMAATDRVLAEAAALPRMIGLCSVLFTAMKALVYAEWAGRRCLGVSRYAVFALLWFGMDPGAFVKRRGGLDWKSDVGIGLLLMGIGAMSAWWVASTPWRHALLMFLPLSLGFHFGALRVLKGGLRAAGFPVRTLFPNVLETRGMGDFWSKRWNVGYSQMMQRLIGRPVENRLGAGAGVMAVFLGSGVLHELAITLPVRSGFGLPTLYFTLQGLLTLFERKLGRPLGKVPAWLAVVLPFGLLFPPAFQQEVIARCLEGFTVAGDLWRRQPVGP